MRFFFHNEDDLYSQLNPLLECKTRLANFVHDFINGIRDFRANDFTKIIGPRLNADQRHYAIQFEGQVAREHGER